MSQSEMTQSVLYKTLLDFWTQYFVDNDIATNSLEILNWKQMECVSIKWIISHILIIFTVFILLCNCSPWSNKARAFEDGMSNFITVKFNSLHYRVSSKESALQFFFFISAENDCVYGNTVYIFFKIAVMECLMPTTWNWHVFPIILNCHWFYDIRNMHK